MDVRTVICSHSSQVTHADIRLVSSNFITINLNIEVGNTSLESDSQHTSLCAEIHTKIPQLYTFKFIFTELKLHKIIKASNTQPGETETIIWYC